MSEVRHRTIETNGIAMHVAEQGEGPLVVLCHGFPESWYSWRHQLRALAEAGFHAVAPDMRGYGRTDAPAEIEKYTLLHLVGDMVGLLDALGEKTAVIAGHDWGAPVAWHAAPLYREYAVAPGLALAAGPALFVIRKRRARLKKFEEQFPESLEFLARSMRAGHAFSVALEMIHSEFQEPLAGEFRRAFDEQNLGLPLDVALEKMAQRVPLMDVHFFVSAVLLQKRTGGNLAELLDKLAYLIRERFKLRGRIRAISAHGRMTGMVLSMIPVAVGLIMFYVNPFYAQFFVEDETGRMMMAGAIGLQLLGYGVIKKIVSIEV